MPRDLKVRHTAALTRALRVWLRARRAAPDVKAAALAYELAALIAREFPTEAEAIALLEQQVETMKSQIRVLGVGVEHP